MVESDSRVSVVTGGGSGIGPLPQRTPRRQASVWSRPQPSQGVSLAMITGPPGSVPEGLLSVGGGDGSTGSAASIGPPRLMIVV